MKNLQFDAPGIKTNIGIIEGKRKDWYTEGGFHCLRKKHEKYRDLRITKNSHYLRENLWSRDKTEQNKHACYNDLLYCPTEDAWVAKEEFNDKRLSKTNHGKRYNLHSHNLNMKGFARP